MRNPADLDTSFELLGNLLPDFVARYDQLGRIRYMNRALLDALSIELADVIGKTPDIAWPDGRFTELQTQVVACLASGQSASLDITIPYAQGRVEYHNIRVVCERSDSGEAFGVLALGRNLTERFLQERNLAAASRLKCVGQLASGICHEVNNPLAIIAASTRRLNRLGCETTPIQGDIIKTVQWIDQAVERIAYIVQSLQILSFEESNADDQTLDISDVITGVLSFFRETFKKESIELIEDFWDEDERRVAGSRSQLSRLLFNLLTNSYDAVLRARHRWIKISLVSDPGMIRIKVIDSGPRLRKDIILRLMQPFFTTKKDGRGAGLGLSVACAIAESHKGRLFYEDANENTCFVLELPKSLPTFHPDNDTKISARLF